MSGVALPHTGPLAPPRRNGELVFAAPWEGRCFAMTVALAEAGVFTWAEFQQALIDAIATWERAATQTPWHYWARWQAALETLCAAKAVCGRADVDGLSSALAARPPGHDHG